jgi:hypothetical protein
MSWEPEQLDGERDPLDGLLADARWEEPSPEAIHRLRGQWRSLMVRRKRRRRLFALATAGSLLAVGLAFWQVATRTIRRNQENEIAGPRAPQSPAGNSIRHVADVPQPRRSNVKNAPLPGAVHERAVARGAAPLVAKKHPTVVKPAMATRSNALTPYEMMMVAAHRRTTRERRKLDDAKPIDVATKPKTEEVRDIERPMQRVAENTDSPTLARLFREEQDRGARKELLSALLGRNDPASVNIILSLVEDPRTSADALDGVTGAPNAPVHTLLQCLRSSHFARRMAAAQVLGRLDQPVVSCELIAMIKRGEYRQEAMIALLSSSEPTARQFLVDAERDPLLAATLWNAKRLYQNLGNTRTEIAPFVPRTNGMNSVLL